MCCSPWCRKESDTTDRLNNKSVTCILLGDTGVNTTDNKAK